MCGICGIINFNKKPVAGNDIEKMLRSMKHRGPNDEGVFLEEHVGLGSVRLSILDLSPMGHMPMISEDERFVIVYNGEVYNYIELREELRNEYTFHTGTDTEVLLNAYRKWGEDCLKRLNGMFAFVIYDRIDKTIFGVRDRFGIKPFYYYNDSQRFVFASEITGILAVLGNGIQQNESMIFDYLIFNKTHHTENTFFKNVKKLQHSHQLRVLNDRVTIKKWYNLADNLNNPFNKAEEYREQLIKSVGIMLRSDVPVGACLSGGLDSSSIVSIIRNNYGRGDIHTFSAIYGDGKRGDESKYIREYTLTLKNMHMVEPTEDSFRENMNEFVRAQTEPVESVSPYAEFKVMELAKPFVTVIMNGQGPDEALGGYHYFYSFYFKELLKGRRLKDLSKELYWYIINHRSLYGIKGWLYLSLPETIKSKINIGMKDYYDREFVMENRHFSHVVKDIYEAQSLHEALVRHYENRFEHHLIMGDHSSMWFSLELRFPFLDHSIVERSLALGNKWIIRNGTTKYILREAMDGIIPDDIKNRQDKVGFETPDDEWFRSKAFKGLILGLLNDKKFKERGYLNIKKASRKYQDHLKRKCNISNEMWKWINLELWFEHFIDKQHGT